ncbi:DNA translocase FtsK [Geobacillus thermodenitrificans]|uniref:DNA translocase FtsK n=1 Tax=Geobacillus thermodenitrificans TaxID=33940 RepID=A0ABY9QC63_GEOTD|nr:DNA translocase FtsK [Geobacillus thermodenitrificans]WMV75688.1 DNA translocase FtsK [Geobacillus thermodenitrificans]
MKFWKRWLRFFTDEEEHERPTNRERLDHRPERAEAKVVYQYPQGRFRFPLIPDDHSLETKKTTRQIVDEESRLKPPRRPSVDTVRETSEKKPFRPSDVPSPIFGYHNNREQRQRLTEQGIIAARRTAEKAKQRPEGLSADGQASSLPSEQALSSRSSDFINTAAPQGTLEQTTHSAKGGAAADRQTEKETQVDAATVQIATPGAEKRMNEISEEENELRKAPFTETAAEAEEQPVELVEESLVLGEPAFTQTAVEAKEPSADPIAEESVLDEPSFTETAAEAKDPSVELVEEAPALGESAFTEIAKEAEEQIEGISAGDDDCEGKAEAGQAAMKGTTWTEAPVSEEKEVPEAMSAAVPTSGEPAAPEMKEEQAHASLCQAASVVEPESGSREGGDEHENGRSATRVHENRLTQPDDRDDGQKEMQELPTESGNRNARGTSKEAERRPLSSSAPASENRRAADRHRPERMRIPYNVMMLKQDRRKLEERAARRSSGYSLPPLSLLQPPGEAAACDEQWIHEQCARLDQTFESFHIGAKVVHATQGPTVTQFEVQPDLGVKVSKITSLTDDIKLSLAARDIRIEAPIPGKRTIGIEVPNPSSRPVQLREILDSSAFREHCSPLTVALGLDISGAPVVTDIKKMPHGLIAGATGSGKSVCMNAMLVSMLYKAAPHEVKWLLIDPKMVELAPYNGLPHLLSPVITEAKAAAGALKWAVREMERRYELFVHAGVRDIEKYNAYLRAQGSGEPILPYIVIVIDELADLMMAAPADVEESICRLAQKARACGIHLLIATQRPSVDVITGLIKANIPTRIAFSVSSQIDSRTILDANGAERLLGRGDMLFLENGSAKSVRLQGCFISDEEIERVTAYVKAQQGPSYMFSPDEFRQTAAFSEEDDELFDEACRFVIAQGGASTSSLQRHFRIGYNRAARLIEMMEEQGLISEARGSKPRDVLMSEEEWTRWRERGALQTDGFSSSEQ